MNGHMQKQLTRSLERILEEAHISGELKLSGRKLKDFPKVGKSFGSIKYNLKDTVLADLSKNRFVEFPEEITEFSFLEKLYLYHNAIRVIPETVTMLQSLSYLDLSRNQMTSLPREICRLPLQTLLISHNRIASLPDELGRMSSLAELDAGCNEIAMLPFRMGDLTRLRILDLHNNFLVHIPIELTYLKLIKLNISGNRISVLPNEFRKMKYLIDLQLLDNPLTSPPAALCIRGRTHVFKYLERQAIKHERSLNGRIKLNTFEQRNYTTLDILSNRQCSNDSSIGIIEGDDKNWSQNIDNKIHNCEIRNIFRKECLPLSITLPREVQINDSCTGTSTPSTISPGENISLEDEFEKMAYIVNQINEEKTRWDIPDGKVNLKNALLSIHQPSIIPVNQIEHSSLESTEQNSFTESITKIEKSLPLDKGKGTLSHIQTYREYKEALRQQRVNEGPSIYKSKEEIIQYRFDSQSNGADASNLFVITNKHTSNEESANKIPVPKIDLSRINIQNNKIINDFNRNASSENLQNISLNTNSSDKYSFTMKREFERAKEEADLIKQLRNNIETRLKMALPENLAPALTDGVVLCHLANHVQPRSVASIHVPSPAVPKLTMARCRRNVDNFLDACRKIGVEEEVLMDAEAIMDVGYMEIFGLEALGHTVSALILNTERSPQELNAGSARMIEDSILSTMLFTAFISTLILLYFYPIPD